MSDPVYRADASREAAVQRRLRLITYGVLAAAGVALALSFIPLDVSHNGELEHRPASTWLNRGLILLAMAPAPWVLRVPRNVRVIVWAVWVVVLLVVSNRFTPVRTGTESIDPAWVEPVLALLWIGISLTVMLALPVVRLGTREPPPPPQARVIRQ